MPLIPVRVIIWPNKIITITTTITAITMIIMLIMIILIARILHIASLARPSLQRDYNLMTRISTMSTADICMRLIRRC
jgi:hypothetical protein